MRHSRRLGWSVDVVSFDGWRPRSSVDECPAGLDERGVFRLSSPAGLEKAREWADAQKAAIVHVHDPLLWEFASAVAQQTRACTVATMHVLHRAMNRHRGIDGETMSSKSEHVVIEEADCLHVTTAWVAQELSTLGKGIESRVRLASLGIDDSEGARLSRAAPKHGPVLYVGRFSDVKGTDTFIEALAKSGSKLGAIQVVGGLPHNPKREARWKKRFEAAAPGRVEFMGWLTADELGRCYAQASVLVVPSRIETFGQVALEGLIHGVPVLASRCAAFRDWLWPQDAAHFFDVGDANALSQQLMALRHDSEARNRLREHGAKAALSVLNWSKTFPALDAIYREL